MARESIEMSIAADSLHKQRAYLKNATQIPSFSGNADVQLATFPKLEPLDRIEEKETIRAYECFQYNIVFELDASNFIHCHAYGHDGAMVKKDLIPGKEWDMKKPLASEFIGEYGSLVRVPLAMNSGDRQNIGFGAVYNLSNDTIDGFPKGRWVENSDYDTMPQYAPADKNGIVTVTRFIAQSCRQWCAKVEDYVWTNTYVFNVHWETIGTLITNAEPSGFWIVLMRCGEMFVVDAGDRYTIGQNFDRVWITQRMTIGDKSYDVEIMDDYAGDIAAGEEYELFVSDDGSRLFLRGGDGMLHPFRTADPSFPSGSLPSADAVMTLEAKRAKKAAKREANRAKMEALAAAAAAAKAAK